MRSKLDMFFTSQNWSGGKMNTNVKTKYRKPAANAVLRRVLTNRFASLAPGIVLGEDPILTALQTGNPHNL